MTNNAVNKVLYNVDQTADTTAAEKATARANIGAQGVLTPGPNIDIYNDVISTEKPRVEAGTNVSVNGVLDPQTRVITYTVSATDTTYNVFSTTTDGLVPKANGAGDTGKFLKGDGTWEAISTTVNATAPLYGTGTQADPIRLLVSHGLSVVQPAGGNSYLQVTHPVPAPGNTSAGKVLTCDDALENLSWQTPAPAPSIVQKLDYGDTSASTVSTLLIDADDPENYTLLKADNSTKGYLVQGPYKTLLDSGVNGVGDTTTPIYIDTDGTFKTLSSTPAGIFMAYYSGYSTGHDNTSYDDIKAASDAGKAVFAYTNVGGGVLFYTLDNIDSTHAMFRRTLNKMSSILTVQESDDSYSLTNVSLQGELTAGTGISLSNDTVSWEYTVGRNLHINQNNAIQTDFGGGKLAPTSTNWEDVGNFSTSYRLVARANTNGTYDIGLRYYAGGLTTHFTFIGTQTVATAGSTAVTVTKCNYIYTQTEYSYCAQIGDHFNPASMQSMIIEGTMFAGTQHDFRAVLWVDENNTVQVAFTAIEVGRVGSTV